MTADVVLHLTPDGADGIALRVTAPNTPAGGATFGRAFLELEPAKLDALRWGDPPPALVDEVTETVSRWLLGQELPLLLAPILNLAQQLRLVVNVDRRIGGRLSELPLELVQMPNAGVPLLLNARIDGLVHLLPFVGQPPAAATARTWPFRVLLVRSNPVDLGGAVPPAHEVRGAIQAAAEDLADGLVEVTVVSSEAAGSAPMTWLAFREALAAADHDLVVYLGHGDVGNSFGGVEPIGMLQFESEDGAGHESIDAKRLAVEFYQHTVPVVVLVGCLTAAELDGRDQVLRDAARAELPDWLRGSQGVAQALVDSESGVQLAVGMRYRLEVDAARAFLRGFFRSLFGARAPGDVELAVRAGRSELFAAAAPLSWSAPVVFGNPNGAPIFEFLATPPPAAFPPERRQALEFSLAARRLVSQQLVQSTGDPTDLVSLLQRLDDEDVRALGKDRTVRPRFVMTAPGRATITVELLGSLKIKRLEGRVSISGAGIEIERVRPDARLDAAGFRLLKDEDGATATFVIDRDGGAAAATLSAGPLFDIEAHVTSTPPFIHEASVTTTAVEPHRLVWPATGLVAVLDR